MNFNRSATRVALSIVAVAVASTLSACNQSKADKAADRELEMGLTRTVRRNAKPKQTAENNQ